MKFIIKVLLLILFLIPNANALNWELRETEGLKPYSYFLSDKIYPKKQFKMNSVRNGKIIIYSKVLHECGGKKLNRLQIAIMQNFPQLPKGSKDKEIFISGTQLKGGAKKFAIFKNTGFLYTLHKYDYRFTFNAIIDGQDQKLKGYGNSGSRISFKGDEYKKLLDSKILVIEILINNNPHIFSINLSEIPKCKK
jgi:hypothetical protein